jgi:hypothetical protein
MKAVCYYCKTFNICMDRYRLGTYDGYKKAFGTPLSFCLGFDKKWYAKVITKNGRTTADIWLRFYLRKISTQIAKATSYIRKRCAEISLSKRRYYEE